MSGNWTQIACLDVRHLNQYTRMISVLVWGCNWIPFMHGWFCPIRLMHLIGRKSLHFEKNIRIPIQWHRQILDTCPSLSGIFRVILAEWPFGTLVVATSWEILEFIVTNTFSENMTCFIQLYRWVPRLISPDYTMTVTCLSFNVNISLANFCIYPKYF